MKDNRPPKEERTLKRGDTREDGMVFWGYDPSYKTGERWVTSDKISMEARRQYNKEWNKKNKEKRSAYKKEWNKNNKEKIAAWNENNKEKRAAYSKGKNRKKYRENNKEKIAAYNKEWNEKNRAKRSAKRRNDPLLRITCNLRSRMLKAVKDQGTMKVDTSLRLCGCSASDLKVHLESQFTEGMTWENHSLHGWHVDHIKPCASFDLTLASEQKECFHYTNLQPLWAKDNLSKGSKLTTNQPNITTCKTTITRKWKSSSLTVRTGKSHPSRTSHNLEA